MMGMGRGGGGGSDRIGSGGAMVLGKLPVQGRPTNLDNSGTRTSCACGESGGLFRYFFSYVVSLFSLSVGDGSK